MTPAELAEVRAMTAAVDAAGGVMWDYEALAVLRAGFHRRAPEPVREDEPPSETPDGRALMGRCEGCRAPFYEGDEWQDWADGVKTHRGECPVPRAQPEPQQQGGEAHEILTEARSALMMCGRILSNMEPVRRFHHDAISAAIDNLNLLLAAPAPAAPAGVTDRQQYLLRDQSGVAVQAFDTYREARRAMTPGFSVEPHPPIRVGMQRQGAVTEAMALAAIAVSEGDDWRLYDTPETAASRIRVMRAALAAALAAAGKA